MNGVEEPPEICEVGGEAGASGCDSDDPLAAFLTD
jgi:hypothetical protein